MNDTSLTDLIEQLSDHDGMTRERARHALVLAGAPAVPLLLRLLEEGDKGQRWEAAESLAAIADVSSVSALIGLLRDRESDLRWIAGKGLVKIGPQCLDAVLRELIDTPDSKNLRQSVHHILHELVRTRPALKDELAPVMEALGEAYPAESMIVRVEKALEDLSSSSSKTASER